MKLKDHEKEFGSFFRFLEGEQKEVQATALDTYQVHPKSEWRQLEMWAHCQSDPDVQALCERAFQRHDQDAMSQLRLEYAWMLQQKQ